MLISVSLVSLGFFNSQSNATVLMVWRKVRALCKRSKLAHLMQSSKFKKTLLTTVVLKAWHRFALQASPPGLKFIMYMNTSTKLERSSHAFWSPVIPTVLVTMLLWWRQELKIPTRKKPAQILGPMLKDGTVHSIVAKITGEKRGAPEGVWVQGGGIELPCKYFVYGLKTSKQRVKHEPRKH